MTAARAARRIVPALAGLFLLAHLATLPSAPDDIDALNFMLGVRDFDVAHHQPHPPGYPVFIALGKLSTPVLRAAGIAAPEVRGLALWSAVAGALLLLLLVAVWRTMDDDPWRPLVAAALTVASPLFWFTALRPLSDVPGLCLTMAAVALVLRALPPPWTAARAPSAAAIVAGAFLAGLAIGTRTQTLMLTAPLLAFAWLLPRSGLTMATRALSIAAAAVGALLWAVPLVVASGGWSGYLTALGSQAGEDFSGVVMLWTNRSPRVAVQAVLNTFVLPWDRPVLAGVMLALAGGGLLVLATTRSEPDGALEPRTGRRGFSGLRKLLLLAVMFGPYAVFHLVFQETATVRYALPLVLPVAYLAAAAITSARGPGSLAVSVGMVLAMLLTAVPASIGYARTPAPIFSAFAAMAGAAQPAALVAMHRRVWTESRRARLWTGEPKPTLLPAPRDYEWLELSRAWRDGDASRTWFVADPRRTDLALVDPASRSAVRYRWPFNASSYVGGARPSDVDLVTVDKPGWFLDQGWSLTPETAGITQRDGWGPHRRPSVGWIRRRPDEARLMIGGRHLGSPSDPPVTIAVVLDDRPFLEFAATPGFFLRFEPIPAGLLAGAGSFAKLAITAGTPGGTTPPVAIEQFDLQPANAVELGFETGWHEPEYNPATGRSWRWMSERATVALRGGDGDVTLRLIGEATRRYFSRPSRLTVSAGGQGVATVDIGRDFDVEVRVRRDLLDKSDGRVSLESDQMFTPGDREGTADRRHLAVRIYSVAVRADSLK